MSGAHPSLADAAADGVAKAALLVDAARVAPQPWRNGGGVTRELLAWPDAADWQLRLSLADIAADGPFSRYDGVQRWIAVLSSAGIWLDIAGQRHVLGPGDAPLQFDGAAAVDCRLRAGPSRDVNLMLRGRPGQLLPALPGQDWTPPAQAVAAGLLTAVAGDCNGQRLPAELLWWRADLGQRPAPLRFDPLRFDPLGLASPAPAAVGWWLWVGRTQAARP